MPPLLQNDTSNVESVVVVGAELLTTREVVEIMRVSPTTVTRWVATGKVSAITLPGGQLRFPSSQIHQLLEPMSTSADSPNEG
ncbi:MerR family transcriptional regulator [Arcanobacterium canis]